MITCTFIFLAISTTLCFTISIFAAYKFDKHKKVAINFLNDSIASSGHTIENMVVEKDEATYLQKLKDKGSIPINIDVKSRPNRKVEITLKASIGLASAVEQSVEKKQLEEISLK